MARPEAVTPADVAALTARLRALSSGGQVDEGARERFLADKDELIARIEADHSGRGVRPVSRRQAEASTGDGADDWTDGQMPVRSDHEPPWDAADDGDSGWGSS